MVTPSGFTPRLARSMLARTAPERVTCIRRFDAWLRRSRSSASGPPAIAVAGDAART
jgi:hypothetical protein